MKPEIEQRQFEATVLRLRRAVLLEHCRKVIEDTHRKMGLLQSNSHCATVAKREENK